MTFPVIAGDDRELWSHSYVYKEGYVSTLVSLINNQLHLPVTHLETMVWPLTSFTQASASTTPNAPAVSNADPSKYETFIYMHLPGVTGT